MLKTLPANLTGWTLGGLAPLSYHVPAEGGTLELELSQSEVQALVRECERLGHKLRDVDSAARLVVMAAIAKIKKAKSNVEGISPLDRMILLLSKHAERSAHEPTVQYFSRWGYSVAAIANRLSQLCRNGLMIATESESPHRKQGRKPMEYHCTAAGDEIALKLEPLDTFEKDPTQYNATKRARMFAAKQPHEDLRGEAQAIKEQNEKERALAARQRALPGREDAPPVPDAIEYQLDVREDTRPDARIENEGPLLPIYTDDRLSLLDDESPERQRYNEDAAEFAARMLERNP